MKNEKKFDLTELNDFFNWAMSPKDLSEELVQLMFNYAISFESSCAEEFKHDAGIIYMLYNEVNKIKEISDNQE